MTDRDIIVIGGSAGSVKALQEIVRLLPNDLDASVLVALHRSPIKGIDYLSSLLSGDTCRRAKLVRDGERFHHGHIYVAPPESHLAIERDVLGVEPVKAYLKFGEPTKAVAEFQKILDNPSCTIAFAAWPRVRDDGRQSRGT